MKHLFAIIFLATPILIYAQNQPAELGIGFVIHNNSYAYSIETMPTKIYRDSAFTTTWDQKDLNPFFYKPDYGLFHFICVDITNSSYRILANDSSFGYIPIDTNFYFKSWEALLMKASVSRLSKENPIYSNPSRTSDTISIECEEDYFQVEDIIQINGEYWLNFYYSPECDVFPQQDAGVKYGWLRWRSTESLLIFISLLC